MPPAAGLLVEHDRVRGRAERVVGEREREPRVVDEVARAASALRRGRQLREQPLRPVEAEDREVVAEHAALAAVQEQVDVADVGLDVRLLELRRFRL